MRHISKDVPGEPILKVDLVVLDCMSGCVDECLTVNVRIELIN